MQSINFLKPVLVFFSLIFLSCPKNALAQNNNPVYDSTLAQQLGSDEYGMKPYIFVLLRSGGNKSTDKSLRDSCFAGHFSNMTKMVKDKKLIIAGPMDKNNEDIRGIFILDVSTIDAASALLEDDLAIANEFLKADIFSWYGSAALPAYLPFSEKIWKIKP